MHGVNTKKRIFHRLRLYMQRPVQTFFSASGPLPSDAGHFVTAGRVECCNAAYGCLPGRWNCPISSCCFALLALPVYSRCAWTGCMQGVSVASVLDTSEGSHRAGRIYSYPASWWMYLSSTSCVLIEDCLNSSTLCIGVGSIFASP
jgi:hypothetical protein